MKRRAARVDENQAEIVKALRAAGCSVQPLHTIGKGCPDLLVGYRRANYLLEVKNSQKPPSARELTDDEASWLAKWQGEARVVNNVEEALKAVLFATF